MLVQNGIETAKILYDRVLQVKRSNLIMQNRRNVYFFNYLMLAMKKVNFKQKKKVKETDL